jgi:hypothetical protein
MLEAKHEREVADSPEAQALQEAIRKAVDAYWQFLEGRGVLWDDADARVKASALVVTANAIEIDIRVRDGALNWVYGNGTNPHPGLGPPDIPHKMRPDF